MKRLLLPIIAASILVGCGSKEPVVDIWTAAASGNSSAIKQHVASGTDIDAQDPAGGSSALIVAALYGQAEVVKILVENGASLDFKNNDGSTALHVAAFFCHPEIVKILLDQGADRSVKNSYGQIPLETVSGEWNSDLEGIYKMVAGMWKLELDLERIRAVRPQVADLIRQHADR
jgi:ankyrin repeat protein